MSVLQDERLDEFELELRLWGGEIVQRAEVGDECVTEMTGHERGTRERHADQRVAHSPVTCHIQSCAQPALHSRDRISSYQRLQRIDSFHNLIRVECTHRVVVDDDVVLCVCLEEGAEESEGRGEVGGGHEEERSRDGTCTHGESRSAHHTITSRIT